MALNLDQMTNMSLLLKERNDPRGDTLILHETRQMLTDVLDHNALPHDGAYTLEEWTNFKRNMELTRFLERMRS